MSADFLPRFRGQYSEAPQSALEAIFQEHEDRGSRKWQHYFRIYEDELAPFRERAPKILEIGVQNGGSLQIWRKFLGPQARIFGVDINPSCAKLDSPDLPVRIGSQNGPEFLRQVVSEMGGLDVVIDDGSHFGNDQTTSFLTLFPLLAEDGLYLIEDLHASYWDNFGGGYDRQDTMISFVKNLIDDLHGWYHSHEARSLSSARTEIDRISVYDSIVAIRKTRRGPPQEMLAGALRPQPPAAP